MQAKKLNTMELSFEQLEKSAKENALFAYFCEDDFKAVCDSAREDNPDASETELKEEIMFRLLDENLDYGDFAEASWEFDGRHDEEHSARMEIRARICEKVSHAWVFANFSNLKEAQKFSQNLLQQESAI